MIRLHHLNQSRSLRVLWLLEELNVPYEIVSHQRDAKTLMAPASLKAVHPLGKSPVLEIDGQLIVESGAIIQLLIERFAPNRLCPVEGSNDYAKYLQWIHFAESSLMLPFLIELLTSTSIKSDDRFMGRYLDKEKQNLLSYLDSVMKNKSFIVANKLSGADFMLAFDLIVMVKDNLLDDYPFVKQYALLLASLDSYQRAMRLEDNYDNSAQHKIIR